MQYLRMLGNVKLRQVIPSGLQNWRTSRCTRAAMEWLLTIVKRLPPPGDRSRYDSASSPPSHTKPARLLFLPLRVTSGCCLYWLIVWKKQSPCFQRNGRSFAEFAYTTWNASLRNPVNSPPTFRSRLAGAPGEDGLFTFRGCLPESARVRDFYFWGARRDQRVSFGGAVVFSAD